MRYPLQPGSIATGLALCASLLATPAHAQDVDAVPGTSLLATYGAIAHEIAHDLLPTSDDFRLDTNAPFHQQQVSRSDPRIKAVDGSQRIYLGKNLLPATNASASEKPTGKLYLEFNQRGAELVFRF